MKSSGFYSYVQSQHERGSYKCVQTQSGMWKVVWPCDTNIFRCGVVLGIQIIKVAMSRIKRFVTVVRNFLIILKQNNVLFFLQNSAVLKVNCTLNSRARVNTFIFMNIHAEIGKLRRKEVISTLWVYTIYYKNNPPQDPKESARRW